ncbi:MAG: C39 family peptidase [Chloroflexota bacterium]|nr:C39 family peptidase [Chloroflexota bacterium]
MQRQPEIENTLTPPPRILFIAAFIIVYALILAGIALITFIQNGNRPLTLIPVALWGAGVFAILTLLGALVFRGSLPRRLFIWLLIIYLIFGVAGAFAGITVYRTALEPRYQEAINTMMPFMRSFLPPTPEGGMMPTSAATSAISPEDLLSMPLLAVTATPQGDANNATITPNLPPTADAGVSGVGVVSATDTTDVPPTDLPTATTVPPTATDALIATLAPTNPPTLAPAAVMPTQAATAQAVVLPASARMYGFTHVQQLWNNCGPANITMALSFFGWSDSQETAANFLKPVAEDKNVTPAEMVNFVNTQSQIKAITRIGGDMDMLKAFIAANIPVIVETSYQFEGYDWIGHYQTVVGYDDAARSFYVYDSYIGTGANGAGIPEPYDRFDRVWQNFNRTFIALYEPDREGLIAQILGGRADLTSAAENALTVAQAEARANPNDAFAWFNMGSSLVELGQYERAAAAYDNANRAQIPFRITWYQFGIFEAYFNAGRYQEVLVLVENNVTNRANVEETYYWQGRVYQAQGDRASANAAFNQALSMNPRYTAAANALASL